MVRKEQFIKKLLSMLLVFTFILGFSPIVVKASDEKVHTVNIDVSDKILEIYSYVHHKALLVEDGKGNYTMNIFLFTDWKKNKIVNFSLYKDSKKSKDNMLKFNFKKIDAELLINFTSKKHATEVISIKNIKKGTEKIEGRYKLKDGKTDDFSIKILWNKMKSGDEMNVKIPEKEEKLVDDGEEEIENPKDKDQGEDKDNNKDKDVKVEEESLDLSDAPFKVTPTKRDLDEATPLNFEYNQDEATIYYTTTGKEPGGHWSTRQYPYQEFTIDKPVVIKARIVYKNKPENEKYGKVYTIKYSFKGKAPGEIKEEDIADNQLFTKGTIKRNRDYDTLTLYTNSIRYYNGTIDVKNYGDTVRKILSTDEYYIDMTQGEGKDKKSEHLVVKGGIGGFIAPYDFLEKEGKVIINLKKNTFDENKPIKARIVLKDSKDTILELDFKKEDNIIKKVEAKSQKELKEEKVLTLAEMEKGKVYTGSFDAVRYDDETRESMLAGFFDKSVKMEVTKEGDVIATFYNTVFADSMIDFAICADDGTWVFTSLHGEKIEEKSERGQTYASTYKLKIPNPAKNKNLIGAVNVLAMGGSDKNNGNGDLYTKVKMKFKEEVIEGFTDFKTRANRLPQHKIINRSLMTVPGLDKNEDGYISDEELKEFNFKDELNLGRERMFTCYNIHDNFDLSDLSFLKKIGKKSNIKTINLNDMRVTNIDDEFYGFNNLERLILSANVIMEIKANAFKDLAKLKELRLSKNMLQTITKDTFNGITNLEGGYGEGGYFNGNFDIANNRISKIEEGAFRNFKSINSFDLSLNELSNIDIAKVFKGIEDKVVSLSLGYNKLTEVPYGLSKLKNMKFLSLTSNDLYRLNKKLDNIENLETLYLTDNRLEALDETLVTSNKKLKKIYLAKNSIKDISKSMLLEMNKGEIGYDTIFENNSLDKDKIDLSGLSEDKKKEIIGKISKNPQKSIFNPKISAKNGKIEFKTDISALDYYIYTRIKGYLASSDAINKAKEILGKDTMDTSLDIIKFRSVNLPDLSKASVEKSILNSSLGQVDSLVIKTEIQKFGGGKFYTVKEWEDHQDETTKQGVVEGSFLDQNATDNGLYRLLFSVKSVVDGKRNQTYAVYFNNQGDSLDDYTEDSSKEDKNKDKDSKGKEKVDTNLIEMLKSGKLTDGKYSVNIRMKKAMDKERKQYSMADNSVSRTVLLEAKDSKVKVSTKFNGMNVEVSKGKTLYGFLGKLSYYENGYDYNINGVPQGDLKEATVISVHKKNGEEYHDEYNKNSSAYPYEVSFPIVNLKRAFKEKYIPLHVFVPIMESIAKNTRDQDVLMEFEWDSIKRLDKDAKLSDIEEKKVVSKKKTKTKIDEENTIEEFEEYNFEDGYEDNKSSNKSKRQKSKSRSKSKSTLSLNEDYPSLMSSSNTSSNNSSTGENTTSTDNSTINNEVVDNKEPNSTDSFEDIKEGDSKDNNKVAKKKESLKENKKMSKGLLGIAGAVIVYLISAGAVFVYNKKSI